MTARLTVTYGLDADAYLVMVDVTLGESEVWILRRNEPTTSAVRFEPGQQLIVTYDEGWRIEPAPSVEVAA